MQAKLGTPSSLIPGSLKPWPQMSGATD